MARVLPIKILLLGVFFPFILSRLFSVSTEDRCPGPSTKIKPYYSTKAFERKERLGFDAIYLIYNPDAPYRLELTDRLLKPHNLDIIYWEAETPKSFLTKSLDKWEPELAIGKVACLSSHISVFMDMIRRNLSNALILEDDIDLEMDLVDLWKEKSETLPEMNWDVLFLGYCFEEPSPDNTLPSFAGWKRGVAVCNHAYAVTTSYVRSFLADLDSIYVENDRLKHDDILRKGVNSFYLDKPLFVQRPRTVENPSTIGTENFLPDQPLIQSAWATLNETMNRID